MGWVSDGVLREKEYAGKLQHHEAPCAVCGEAVWHTMITEQHRLGVLPVACTHRYGSCHAEAHDRMSGVVTRICRRATWLHPSLGR